MFNSFYKYSVLRNTWHKEIITLFFCLSFLFGQLFFAIFLQASEQFADTDEIALEEERKNVELDITKHQIKIQRLHDNLQNQKDGVEKTRVLEKGILSEIEDIDLRLNKTLKKLGDLQSRMDEQQLLISNKEKELQEVRDKKERVQRHLQNRMGAYYKLGKIDFINITFSTQTLPELLKFHDSFQSVLKYDQSVLQNYRKTVQELQGATEALTLERGLLEEFIHQTNQEEKALTATKKDKENLLNNVKNQGSLHNQAIKEIEQARQSLTQSLIVLKEKEELFDQGFLLNKRKHIPPVNGTIVSLFNRERVNKFGINKRSPGISFEAADGTKIRAIFDGKVIFSGYLKGYGNTVILDHGYQYYSIVSRIERILVTKGNFITKNEIIGIMGETATIIDDGLYFEIRHKEKPLNPLHWLNRKLLTFKQKK